MKTSEVDILIVPGWSGSGPDHWQSRWERALPTARRVEQTDWRNPVKDQWVGRIIEAIADTSRPPVLVAHSLGVAAVAHAASKLPPGVIAGAFLVAPADVDNAALWPLTQGQNFEQAHAGFSPIPLVRLPFPSTLVVSSNDPYCSLDRAHRLAEAWGARLVEAGPAGHINVASGHGPWPEGLLHFGFLLRHLDGPAPAAAH